MSEFNIKQQNRNRFKSSKSKKQSAKLKETEKLVRIATCHKKWNTSESSEFSEESFQGKKSTARSERRKNRERRNSEEETDSDETRNVNVELQESFADPKHDNASPFSNSPERERHHQHREANDPSSTQNVKKAKPQNSKVFMDNDQQNKQAKTPDELPRPPKKEKVKKKNQTQTMTFEPYSPVPKVKKTNFQWFNPSVKEEKYGHKNKETSKTQTTSQSNSYVTNKPAKGQQNQQSAHKGHHSKEPITFTTAGLSHDEMKTVGQLFSEPASAKQSKDSDLSDKYDCSKNKHTSELWRSTSSYQETSNKLADSKTQLSSRHLPHDKLKDDSFYNDDKNLQKYGKRAIKSHANRNYDLPEYEDSKDEVGEDFDDLSEASFSVSSYFLMTEQKKWLEQSNSYANPFVLNLKCLAAGLHTIPFYQRQSLPQNMFTPDEISQMTSEATSKRQIFGEIRHEAEEEKKAGVFREIDDNILKDDFIGDFLTCGDSVNTKQASCNNGNDGIRISGNTLKLELDEDIFKLQFDEDVKVDDKKFAKSKKKRYREHKKYDKKTDSEVVSEDRSIKSVEASLSGLELKNDPEIKSAADECKKNEKFANRKGKLECKPTLSTDKVVHSTVEKGTETTLDNQGNKTFPSPKTTEKILHITEQASTPPSSIKVYKNSDEQIVSNQDGDQSQSPSQCTEKRSRVRGSSAFNITESLSGLLAEKSDPAIRSNTIPGLNSLNVESSSGLSACETGGKSSPLNTTKLGGLENNFKKLNFDSSTNFKFDFKLSNNSTSPTTTRNGSDDCFKMKSSLPFSSKTSGDFYFNAKNHSQFSPKNSDHFNFKAKNNSPSSSKQRDLFEFRAKSNSPSSSKTSDSFDFKTKRNPSTQVPDSFEFKKNSNSIPSMVITQTNKTTPAINIVNKNSGSKSTKKNRKASLEASSLASESSSSSCGRPVIDDDEMDILLSVSKQRHNRENSSCGETVNENIQSGRKDDLPSTTDTNKSSTSMLDENLDDWLDSVLQS